jgi:hypothetical protein
VVAYVAAGSFDTSASPDYSPSKVGFAAPAGGFVASVTSVQCWVDASQQFSSCTTGSSLQQVTLNIASSDSRVSETLLVIVRRP